jgi:hypothetical protein
MRCMAYIGRSTLAVCLLLAGTAVTAVELPSYRAGDTFIFSDGRVETALRMDGRDVIWRSGNGSRFTRPRNFVIPAVQWETSRTRGRRVVRGDHEKLWPLSERRATRFRTVAEVRSEKEPLRRIAELWSCRPDGTERLTLKAGTFETRKISCDRYSPANMRVQRRVNWFYSAEVGHYVRRETIEFATGRRSQIDLVAALHGRDANRAAIRSILASVER